MNDNLKKESRINWLDEKGEPNEINIPGMIYENLWEYLSGKSTHDLSKDLIQIIFADRRFVEAIKYYIEHKVIGERGGYYWTDDELRSYLNELHLYELIRKLCISIYEYRQIETKKE